MLPGAQWSRARAQWQCAKMLQTYFHCHRIKVLSYQTFSAIGKNDLKTLLHHLVFTIDFSSFDIMLLHHFQHCTIIMPTEFSIKIKHHLVRSGPACAVVQWQYAEMLPTYLSYLHCHRIKVLSPHTFPAIGKKDLKMSPGAQWSRARAPWQCAAPQRCAAAWRCRRRRRRGRRGPRGIGPRAPGVCKFCNCFVCFFRLFCMFSLLHF